MTIEFEIVFNGSEWIETFKTWESANIRWNELMKTGAKVYTSPMFSPEKRPY